MQWKQRNIPISCGHLSVWEIGEGSDPVVFLHGGPGDAHNYLREVAEAICTTTRCILFDQRGSAESKIVPIDATTVNIEAFISDIDVLHKWLGVSKVRLFGHSWGAMYGLFYNILRPDNVASNALISIGPLTAEFERANSERSMSVLSVEDQQEMTNLRKLRNQCRDNLDISGTLKYDRLMMHIRVKSWVYHEHLRDAFLKSYFNDPPVNRAVNQLLWKSIQGWFRWSDLDQIQNPVWICHGQEDATPVEEVFKLEEHLSNSNVTVLEKCGHIPWIDQKDAFLEALDRNFLNRDTLE